jgi:hypothetical protein
MVITFDTTEVAEFGLDKDVYLVNVNYLKLKKTFVSYDGTIDSITVKGSVEDTDKNKE